MKRLSLVARIWLGLIFVATLLAGVWFFYVYSVLAGIAVYDFHPDALQKLSDSEGEDIVRTAKFLMFASAVPPLLLCLGWAATVAVLLRRRSPAE